MDDIFALLNINQCLIEDFPLKANNLVDHQTELAINRCVRSLKEVEERMMSDKSVQVSQQSVDVIIQKVIENAQMCNSDMSIWSIRELRIVSYYLMKLQGNEKNYLYALSLLENNWRDMFFNGLSFYCLDSWNMINRELRLHACELLRKKLAAYQGNNRKYMVMKNHANLFDESGPLRLAAILIQKKLTIMEAPSLFYNKPSTIIQSFYSDVIVNYYNTKRIMNIDEIEPIFDIHQLERTKKLVLADLVIRINQCGDDLNRTQVCKFVNRILGDITLSSTWAPFSGAIDQDIEKLCRAKNLVNLWYNQKAVETFFEVCVQDRYRKDFWLGYVDYLSSFRIVGSLTIKKMLLSDSRIDSMFIKHFIETDSTTSQTSALVLFIKNKMMVEFSDTGALYVYNKGHRMVQKVLDRRNYISNTNDLKIPSMDQLITIGNMGYLYLEQQGRMTHQGDWQSRLREWMQRIVLSSDDRAPISCESDDNDLFQAKPVSKKNNISSTIQRYSTMRDLFSDLPKDEQPQNTQKSFAVLSPQLNIIKSQNTKKMLPVVYEKDIWYSKSSKFVFNEQCKIVANDAGFYLYIIQKDRFVKLRNDFIADNSGSIWVKRPKYDTWYEIVYALNNEENVIGFIKKESYKVLFKHDPYDEDFMTIKL